jgi:serine O-acetyltransferase
VIQTKNDLQRFLSVERGAYLYGGRKDTIIAYLTDDPRAQIWRFQKRLRICEYRYNNRHRSPLHYMMFLWARKRKNSLGMRLGFEISENIFDEGLRLYHCGNIVVNGDSRIGKNCVLHGANCIGNAAKDFAAPQLGDNVDIGVGASIIGNVTITDNVTIGAGAVVTRSITQKNTTVVGIPARPIR